MKFFKTQPLSTDVDADKASTSRIPTVKAVYDWVVGLFVKSPASSTNNAIVRWDGTTGKLVKNSNASIDDTGNLLISKTTGSFAYLRLATNSLPRWDFGVNSVAESGSNLGSNFYVNRFDDAGNYIAQALTVTRNEGNLGIGETAPTAKLEVKGSGATGATTALLVKNSNNQGCLSVLDNRYVGIGETAPTRALVCNYNSSSTNAIASSFALKTTSSSNMADGFGGGMLWVIQDDAGIENLIAGISAERDGADNTGKLRVRVFNAGSSVYPITIKSTGNIGIDTETPTTKLDINSDILRLRTAKTPGSATAAGNAGDICWDANYVYVCTATNTWKRSAIATW